MVHYEPVKITIDALDLAEVIIDIVVRHHGLPDSFVIDKGFLFTLKFWSLLLLLPWHQATALYHLPSANKRANQVAEQHYGGIPLSLCQFRAE